MNQEFKTINDLYNRIRPALVSRCNELRKLGYKDVLENDIWDYLTSYKWKDSVGLNLSDMVSDIFSVDPGKVKYYVIGKNSK